MLKIQIFSYLLAFGHHKNISFTILNKSCLKSQFFNNEILYIYIRGIIIMAKDFQLNTSTKSMFFSTAATDGTEVKDNKTPKPLLFKATANDAVKSYAKLSNPWLRSLTPEARAEKDSRTAKATKSPWLNQILETKYDVLA